jgi:hypothetical protein
MSNDDPIRDAAAWAPLRRAYGANMERVFESQAIRWRFINALTSAFRKPRQSEKPLVG